MNVFQFMSDSPFVTLCVVYMVTSTFFRCWNRVLRHLNVRSKGWPPAHLDADGDFKPEPEPEKDDK
jgi:hypothetical protein